MIDRKAVLLIGSPKGLNSASHTLAFSLLEELQKNGFTHERFIARNLSEPADFDRFYATLCESDLLLVSFPLYVDQLPAPLISALQETERLARGSAAMKGKQLAVIVNCGFPETRQNDPAAAIMKIFSRQCGFEWGGALALGMGGFFMNKKPSENDRMTRGVLASLKTTAESLSRNQAIPEPAIEQMAAPLMPRWLYILMGNLGWRWLARKNGARKQMFNRPYLS